jgi:hypothetical protein
MLHPRALPAQVARNRPHLLDPYGRNLTPRALLPTQPPGGGAPERAAHAAVGVSGRSGGLGASGSQWGGRPATSDGVQVGEYAPGEAGPSDGLSVGGGEAEAPLSGEGEGGGGGAPTTGAGAPARALALSETALQAMVTVTLTETATVTVLCVPSTRSLADTPEARAVAAANEAYEAALLQVARYRNEMYPSRGVGAPSPATRDKECAAVPPPQVGGAAQASAWDIADTQRAAAAGAVPYGALGAGGEEEEKAGVEALEAVVAAIVTVSMSAPGALIDADGSVALLPEAEAGAAAVGGAGKRGGGRAAGASAAAGGGGGGVGASASGAVAGAAAAAAAAAGPRRGSRASMADSLASGGAWGRLGDSNVSLGSRFGGGGTARPGVVGVGEGGGGGGASSAGGEAAASGGGGGAGGGEEAAVDPLLQQEFDALVQRPALQRTLALAERAALQNNFSDSLKLYRAGPSIDLTTRLLTAGAHATHGYESAAAVLSAGAGGGGGGGGGDAKAAAAAVGMGKGSSEESDGEDAASRPGSASSAPADGERAATPVKGGAAPPPPEGKSSAEGGGGEEGAAPPAASPTAAASPAPLTAAQQAAAASAAAYAAAAALPPTPPGVQLLWSYFCPLLRGYSVSAMAWCEAPGTKDLLAVGYGPTDFGATPDTGSRGLVCLWTLANPTQPAAILRTPEHVGVSSLAFSAVAPRLLAVGCYDGGLCVFDAGDALAASQAQPAPPVAISERLAPGSHSEPVWGLQWVPRPESAGGQVLVSISTDGRVTEWTAKKGVLLPRQLMKLRRGGAGGGAATGAGGGSGGGSGGSGGSGGGGGGGGNGGLLARSAPGLSLEFVFDPPPPAGDGSPPPQPRDGAPTPFYWVGTEEGTLARCSTLYSEQYMDTVAAHSGPINRVRLSPFSHAAILTASSDWSVKLWNAAQLGGAGGGSPPCLTFSTDGTRDSVADVAWSPTISTRFASVTRDGHVQVRWWQ